MNYTAEIQHSKETFQRLAKIQHDEYGVTLKLLMIAIGATCLLIGAAKGFNNILSIVFLFTGCWTFTSLNIPAQRNADKMISLAEGSFPHTKYVFLEKEIQITNGETTTALAYDKVYDLLEDNDYFFLFLNNVSGYMIPKRSIRPADLGSFTSFLEEKIGLERHRVTSLLTLNMRTRLKRHKARRLRLQKKSS